MNGIYGLNTNSAISRNLCQRECQYSLLIFHETHIGKGFNEKV
jgi:hypothetical protein